MTEPLCVAVNFHTAEFDVYVGRAGRGWVGYFGNPYKRNAGERKGATLERFKAYFLHRIETDTNFNSRVLALAGKRLGCPGWCKPEACHAGIIAAWVNEAMKSAEWLSCAGCDASWTGLEKDHCCPDCNGGPFCSECRPHASTSSGTACESSRPIPYTAGT